MDLGEQVKNAIENLRSFRDSYKRGHSDGKLLILPAEDLIDVSLEKRCDELPEGYAWIGPWIMDSPNLNWIDRITEPDLLGDSQVQSMIRLLTENQLNPQAVAYRSGYLDGIGSVNAEVLKNPRLGGPLTYFEEYMEHTLSTRKALRAFSTGLLGKPLNEFKDSESAWNFCYGDRGSFSEKDRSWIELMRKRRHITSYRNGLSLAIWRDFQYRIAGYEHFIVTAEAFDAFSRGLTNEAALRNINNPKQERFNAEAHKWGKEIAEFLQKCYSGCGVKADPCGFGSIKIDRIYGGTSQGRLSIH